MLFLHNTSQVADEPYPKLLSEKGFTGFPTLAYLNASGDVLLRHPYDKFTVAGFEEVLPRAKRFAEIVANGDKATPEDRKEVFLTQLKDGVIKRADLQARADKLPLDDAQKAQVASALVDLEINEIMRASREAGPEKTGEALAAMASAGKTPSDQMASRFWPAVLGHAAKTKDAKLAKQAFDELDKRFGKNERMSKQLENWRKQLEEANAQ